MGRQALDQLYRAFARDLCRLKHLGRLFLPINALAAWHLKQLDDTKEALKNEPDGHVYSPTPTRDR